MSERRLARWIALALASAGAVLVGLRREAMREPGARPAADSWRLSCQVSFSAREPGGRVTLALPEGGRAAQVVREEFAHRGLWVDVVRSGASRDREITAVSLSGGESLLAAEFDIVVPSGTEVRPRDSQPASALPTAAKAYYLRSEDLVQVTSPQARATLGVLVPPKATRMEIVERSFSHCSEAVARGGEGAPADAAGVLEQRRARSPGRARAMAALCRAGGVPARLVTGFVLDDDPGASPHVWVEAWVKDRWLPYDPEYGYAGELPAAYLPVRHDASALVRSVRAEAVRTSWSIRRLLPGAAEAGHAGPSAVLDLYRLPVGMQNTLTLLLLLPLGALITAIFRNVIGLETFGTFTPSLLALSFVYADWRTGAVVFLLVMGTGLAGRRILERLKLLMVPRLGLIMTVVVACMALAVSGLDYLGLTPSARAVLLPVVILTMMIERFHIKSEEDGFRHSARVLGSTLLVAGCCLLVLRWESLGRLALTYPEAQLMVAAALVAVGRYAGYRLSELVRFRDVAGNMAGGAGGAAL